MESRSNKLALFILGLTAIVCSRVLFAFFNDPEGPNLFVVGAVATVLYAVSVVTYVYHPTTKHVGSRKLIVPVFVQVVVAAGLYVFLR